MLKYLILFPLFLLSSCSNNMLTIYSDYVDETSLASYYVNTPDPNLSCPPVGQRLIISYALPKKIMPGDKLYLSVTIRFKNREELVEFLPIKKSNGCFIYSLLNEDYCEKRGFLTYKVQLIKGSCIIEEWKHQLWAEIIHFKPD